MNKVKVDAVNRKSQQDPQNSMRANQFGSSVNGYDTARYDQLDESIDKSDDQIETMMNQMNDMTLSQTTTGEFQRLGVKLGRKKGQ